MRVLETQRAVRSRSPRGLFIWLTARMVACLLQCNVSRSLLALAGFSGRNRQECIVTIDPLDPIAVALVDIRAALEAQPRLLPAAQVCLESRREKPHCDALGIALPT